MKIFKEAMGWAGSIGVSFVLVLFIGIFVFQPYKVDGHSMDPTLQDNERIYVSKLVHTFGQEPEYGDIVVIDSRVDRPRTFKDSVMEQPVIQMIAGTAKKKTFYVKRVIGKAGDVLEFKDHQVHRNGQALEEPYIKETMKFVSDHKWTVPEGHVFVMGDNRNDSEDSRDIGFIPLGHVMGVKKLP
ncbi:signal peptidase I [Paenibacillus sp. UNC499MF]|uniref:signal peptidase I n=1 Tax=Paenibacillus sp. UNC499MF TaxID=1502751 RepID=UPI0008A02053|nr:signal peptidase I [Paenibacillus sp. UNC499MF]SEF56425.1 signal peptidase I [Paenibacillus sp. UNC499MF]